MKPVEPRFTTLLHPNEWWREFEVQLPWRPVSEMTKEHLRMELERKETLYRIHIANYPLKLRNRLDSKPINVERGEYFGWPPCERIHKIKDSYIAFEQ